MRTRAYQFAWSYSRLAMYEKCPAQYAHKHVWKTPMVRVGDDPEFFLKGRKVHGGMAAYLLGGENGTFYADQDKKTYHASDRFAAKHADKFQTVLDQLRASKPLVEQQWGYTNQYKPSTWFGNDVYWRVILDVGVLWPDNTFSVVDWKTGKPSADNAEQMEQFAIGVFQRYPMVNWLETRLFYVDHAKNNEQHEEFTRQQLPKLIQKYEKRVEPMKNDETYAPRPGKHCHFCDFAKAKGGPCRFGG